MPLGGDPEIADPEIADLGHYAPSHDLVLYCGDVGYYDGIVRIGRFDVGKIDLVEGPPDDVNVTIERG